MSVLLLIWRLVSASPWEANEIVADGDQWMEFFLDRTCAREARCQAVSIHERDRWASRRVWNAAKRAGLIDPQRCPFHRYAWDPQGWSTRGAYGLMAGYAWKFLDGLCAPPSILDIPLVSAWVARKKAAALCSERRACSYRARTQWWARGAGPEDKDDE